MNADGRRWKKALFRYLVVSAFICVHLRFDSRSAHAAPDPVAPTVAVYQCAQAKRWLDAAGIPTVMLTPESVLSEGMSGVGALVLPLDQIRTETQARWVIDFAGRGGKILGVYWGALVRPEAQARYPAYALTSLLGVRPTGWRGADPLVIRPGDRPDATSEIVNLRVPKGMLVRVEPAPGATILARWAPPGLTSDAATGLFALSFGSHLYLALDLFAPQNDIPAARQLFYWSLEQLSPGIVYGQARERAGAAMAAVIRAENLLAEDADLLTPTKHAAFRNRLAEARDCATLAKKAVIDGQFGEATAQSVRARTLVDEVVRQLRPETATP
jgi:hypothetical protein